ncbi:Sua5/YciO/YrdC/YwlC family protein [Methylovorus sp. SPW-M1]
MMNARELRHYLRHGGVIAYPTESCFGLGCDPHSRLGVQRILRLKGRPQRKGLILIGDQQTRFKRLIAPLSPEQQARVATTWPGPHTWLVPHAKDCPIWLHGRHPSLAVRVTAHPLSARLCRMAGMALVSTSANKAGHAPAKTTRKCRQLFGQRVRVIAGLTGGARKPSTIQDLITGRILRP